jgi:type IV pilus assembly protein PilV
MNTYLHSPRGRRTAGFTMIEVLVTVVVMALGLLGFAALQSVALKSNRTSLHRSYATFYAYDIADCMRVNRAAAVAGSYNLDFGTAATGGTIAGDDMAVWKAALARDLPSGEGKVTIDNQGNATIEVQWSEEIRTEDVQSARTLNFTTQTSL